MTIESSLAVEPSEGNSGRILSPEFLVGFVFLIDILAIFLSGRFAPALFLAPGADTSPVPASVILIAAVFSGAVLHALGCYRHDLLFSSIPRVRPVLAAWFVMSLALSVFAAWFAGLEAPPPWMLWWAAGGAVLLVIDRCILSLCLGLGPIGRLFAQRAVVIGAGELGQRLAGHLGRRPDPLVRLTGFVDDRSGRVPDSVGGLPVLGGVDKLIDLARAGAVEQVFIALPWSAEARIKAILDRLDTLPLQIRLAPDLVGYGLPHRQTSSVAGLPVLNAVDRPISGWDSLVKAVEDKVLGLVLLVLCLPLMAAITLAIRLDSPGPVLFRQTRLGFNDRPFGMFKFRSMYHDMADPDGSIQATKDDCRVTRVGRFLRRFSLDELPQIFNVLSGDMSVVGPRPHPVGMVAAGRQLHDAVRKYAARHKVKPGITGWAQVNSWRGETDTLEKIEKRVEFDLYYIEHWSLWLDAWILLKTGFVAVRDPNAY